MPTLSLVILSVLVMFMLLVGGSMVRLKPGDTTFFKKIAYPLMVALLLTLSSLFWTKDIAYDPDTLKHLEFGWPIPFVIQNQERYDPPFPYAMRFGWDLAYISNDPPPHQIAWMNGFASVAINYFIVLAAWYLCSLMLRRK